MRKKPWLPYYLMIIGSVILTLGLILLLRNFFLHGSSTGFILGIALIIYGLIRFRQGRHSPSQR